MYVIPGSDPTVGLINLLANPTAAAKQLKDLVDATNKHQEALDKLLNEQKNQKSIEVVKADCEAREAEANKLIEDYNKLFSEHQAKTASLSSKQEELNQRIADFNKYLENSRASMVARENSILDKAKETEILAQKSKEENEKVVSLRKSLEDKHTKIKAIVNS